MLILRRNGRQLFRDKTKIGSGWQPPAAISHAFEDPTLAVHLGERMMDRVIADLKRWRKLGLKVRRIAVNISVAEASKSDMADRILAKFDRAGLSPDDLDIEVTESVILGAQATDMGHALRLLHTRGVSIALDDFGTGYASLTHLRQYPFDWLKIDRSFVHGLEVDADADAIVSAVIRSCAWHVAPCGRGRRTNGLPARHSAATRMRRRARLSGVQADAGEPCSRVWTEVGGIR